MDHGFIAEHEGSIFSPQSPSSPSPRENELRDEAAREIADLQILREQINLSDQARTNLIGLARDICLRAWSEPIQECIADQLLEHGDHEVQLIALRELSIPLDCDVHQKIVAQLSRFLCGDDGELKRAAADSVVRNPHKVLVDLLAKIVQRAAKDNTVWEALEVSFEHSEEFPLGFPNDSLLHEEARERLQRFVSEKGKRPDAAYRTGVRLLAIAPSAEDKELLCHVASEEPVPNGGGWKLENPPAQDALLDSRDLAMITALHEIQGFGKALNTYYPEGPMVRFAKRCGHRILELLRGEEGRDLRDLIHYMKSGMRPQLFGPTAQVLADSGDPAALRVLELEFNRSAKGPQTATPKASLILTALLNATSDEARAVGARLLEKQERAANS
ncbi:MAG: hypothetical protein KDD70_04895 [Bdellovibrionales bacterium]|nr:hypothetical protein [Bdellovibrionales bacterium]